MNIHVPIEPPQTRSEEILKRVLGQYRFLKSEVKSDQSLELVASVHGRCISPLSFSSEPGDFICIESRTEKEGLVITYAPVESVALTILVENKVPKDPPREIGFRPSVARQHLEE